MQPRKRKPQRCSVCGELRKGHIFKGRSIDSGDSSTIVDANGSISLLSSDDESDDDLDVYFDGPHVNTYLPNYFFSTTSYTTLKEAQRICIGCNGGGVTQEDDNTFTVREKAYLMSSPTQEISWVNKHAPSKAFKQKRSVKDCTNASSSYSKSASSAPSLSSTSASTAPSLAS